MDQQHAELAMTWGNMIARCYDPNAQKFHHYGGRGIRVTDRWHDFRNFAADMAPRPEGHSLDRIDVNGDYSPENCRWADDVTQGNNRRNNIRIEIDGRTQTAMEWSRESGTHWHTIAHRIRNGWEPRDAVFGRKFARRYPGVTIDGINRTVKQWAKHLGVSYTSVKRRISEGMPPEEALVKPIKTYKNRRDSHVEA